MKYKKNDIVKFKNERKTYIVVCCDSELAILAPYNNKQHRTSFMNMFAISQTEYNENYELYSK